MNSNKDNIINEQVGSRLDDLFGEDDDGQGAGPENEPDNSVEDHAANEELDNRLDNFFEKEDKDAIDPNKVENSAIKDLKSVILSLEWEITDQVMQKLGDEIKKLESVSKGDKIVVAFLQLLGSLGKYIRNKRAEAHPDSIRLLHSVYEHLEKVMLSETLNEAAKKKMLVTQVNRYKKLKEDIIATKASASKKEPKPEEKPVKVSEPDVVTEAPVTDDDTRLREDDTGDDETIKSHEAQPQTEMSVGLQPHQDVLKALEDIRKTIQDEFGALREELKLWRESQN